MYFQKGRLTVSIRRRSPQDTRDGFDMYSAQTSFAWPRIDLARLLRRDDFRLSLEFVKVCWIRFSSLEIFIGFYMWCYPISTIHSMFIYRWSSNFVETLSWKESNGGRDAISCLLPCVLYCMEGEFEQIISKIRLSKGQQQLTAE